MYDVKYGDVVLVMERKQCPSTAKLQTRQMATQVTTFVNFSHYFSTYNIHEGTFRQRCIFHNVNDEESVLLSDSQTDILAKLFQFATSASRPCLRSDLSNWSTMWFVATVFPPRETEPVSAYSSHEIHFSSFPSTS